jgi:hypothetical protein
LYIVSLGQNYSKIGKSKGLRYKYAEEVLDNAWENEERRNLILDIARMSESIPDSCSKIFIVAKK